MSVPALWRKAAEGAALGKNAIDAIMDLIAFLPSAKHDVFGSLPVCVRPRAQEFLRG